MERYRLSFTFGGLLVQETRVIAKEYVKDRDWNSVKSRILEQNLLQKIRLSSSQRYFGGIRDRLSSAHNWEVDLIASTVSFEEEITVILAITVRYYRFLRDFIIEVVRHKWLGKDTRLQRSDLESFFEDNALKHEELTRISDSTKKKLKQVTLRILQEGRLLAANKRDIHKLSVLPPLYRKYTDERDFDSLRIFLLSDREIEKIAGAVS